MSEKGKALKDFRNEVGDMMRIAIRHAETRDGDKRIAATYFIELTQMEATWKATRDGSLPAIASFSWMDKEEKEKVVDDSIQLAEERLDIVHPAVEKVRIAFKKRGWLK